MVTILGTLQQYNTTNQKQKKNKKYIVIKIVQKKKGACIAGYNSK